MRAFIAAMILCLCLADIAEAGDRHQRQALQAHAQAVQAPLRSRLTGRSSYERASRFDGGRSRSSYRPASRPPYPSSYRRRR